MSTFLTIIKSILSVALMLFRYAFYRVISSFLTGLVLLFIAVLMFVTFYQAYMPVVSHVKPVYLQFSSDCQGETSGLCTFPEANVFFTSSNKANEERMLMRGQAYKVFLDLEMPPSPTNEKLGMFMVNIKFLSAKGMVLRSSSRSCMLHYESSLVRLFRTIFYSLPLTLGITEEKQKVELNFFDDYIDDSYNPAVQAKVVIMTKQVEIYSSTLRLQASFTGLRYLIFNWPLLFSCVAILGNFITVTLLYSACINQFMPSTATPTITSRVTQQQSAANTQRQNTTSQLNRGSTSSAVITLPAASVEAVSSNAERPSEPRSSQPEEQNVCASTSSDVRRRRITRVASVKFKLSKKHPPKLGHAGERRTKKVKIGRIEIPDLAQESLTHDDYPKLVSNQNTASSDDSYETPSSDLTGAVLKDPSRNSSTSLDEFKLVSKSSPKRVGHVRKRRKADFGTKTVKERPCCQSKTWRIVNREVVTDKLRKNIPNETSSENKQNETGVHSLGITNLRSLNDTKSVWDNFCIAKNWEYFKFPRIRRLGMYLQEALPSVSQNIRHCVSDLELTSVEEKRLNNRESGSPKRSVSASDITSLDGTTTDVSKICH